MKALYNPCIIFSVKSNNRTQFENDQLHEVTHRVLQLEGFDFLPASGVTHRWGKERSFLVTLPPRSNPEFQARQDRIFAIARKAGQESLMVVNEDRSAELHYADNGDVDGLGTLKQVREEDALASGNYTLCNGLYYTTI